MIDALYVCNNKPLLSSEQQAAEPFGGNLWCDDHTCVEIDRSYRCAAANMSLRRAMASVLGPTSINEKKFTTWFTVGKSLGLMWDIEAGTVSIPIDKLTRAIHRIQQLISCPRASRSDMNKLLGSLRHVSSCFRPARAFFQQLQVFANSIPDMGAKSIPAEALEDLRWFQAVLYQHDQLNSIPVIHFANASTASVDVYMDACDEGLCAIEPQIQQFIRVRFSEQEQEAFKHTKMSNSINIRELRSAVLAALHWGPTWAHPSRQPVHVRFWIDNTSAVSWASRRASRHPVAQLYNRLLSLCFNPTSLQRSLQRMGSMLRDQAIAVSTGTKYGTHWHQWERFCALMHWSPWLKNDRRANKRLGYYAVYLWRYGSNRARQGNQYSTIKLKLASIRWYHRRFLNTEIDQSPSTTILMKGIKRMSKSTVKKQPITPSFLRLLRKSIDLHDPKSRILWGSVLIGYFSCCEDLNISWLGRNDTFIVSWRTMHACGNSLLCPVLALRHIRSARAELGETHHAHLCVDLQSQTVSQAFKKVAIQAGVPPSRYSTHSIRSRGATALMNGQVDSLAVKMLGRWLSNCYEGYPTQSAKATRTLSRRMV